MAPIPSTLPDGRRRAVREIGDRYGAGSVVGRFIRHAWPEIFAAAQRAQAMRAIQPRWVRVRTGRSGRGASSRGRLLVATPDPIDLTRVENELVAMFTRYLTGP
ncbi:hypothetical protein ABIA38_008965 [Embleya sp. AB8]